MPLAVPASKRQVRRAPPTPDAHAHIRQVPEAPAHGRPPAPRSGCKSLRCAGVRVQYVDNGPAGARVANPPCRHSSPARRNAPPKARHTGPPHQGIQQMIAEVDLRWIVRDWGTPNRAATSGSTSRSAPHWRKARIILEGERAIRPRTSSGHISAAPYQPARQPPLLEHGVQRVFIQIAILFGEEGRQTKDAEPRMRLHQVRGRGMNL